MNTISVSDINKPEHHTSTTITRRRRKKKSAINNDNNNNSNNKNDSQMACHSFRRKSLTSFSFSSSTTYSLSTLLCGVTILCLAFQWPQSSLLVSGELLVASGPLMGPIFIDEPPTRVDFSNNTGTILACSATSALGPVKTWWASGDGQGSTLTPIVDIAGLRYVRPNGQLVFAPFALNQFRQDVHATTYRCIAENSFGRLRSRDCQLRAVIQQNYKMQVYDEFVIRDNIAVMRCQVPPTVRDYVRVVAWLRDSQVVQTIATSVSGSQYSSRFTILSSGELIIRNVTFTDAGTYRCQTRHSLTDELKTSDEGGRLIVTEPHGEVVPRVWSHNAIKCDSGALCDLVCVGHGWPLPSYRWFRESESGVLVTASHLLDVELRDGGSVVRFRPTSAHHSGQWVCVANNTAGEEKVAVRVQVSSPLEIQLEPRNAQIDAGKSITFNCSVKGGPPVRPPTWFHNGRPLHELLRDGHEQQRIRFIDAGSLLHISSVRREDIGVYQCLVQSENEERQAASDLRLGDVAPVLLETFPARQIVESSGTISLRCTAVGTPLPQIRWMLDDQPVPNVSRMRVGDHVTPDGKVVSFVNITSARVVDGGEYSCVASNEVGISSHHGQMLVVGAPSVRVALWESGHNLSVVAGRDTVIRCPVIGYPLDSVIWQHNGNRLPTNHRQTIESLIDGAGGVLRIKDVHAEEDSGDYECAVKGQGEGRPVRGVVQMRVHLAPKINRHTLPTHLSAKQGDRIKLMCSVVEGDGPVEIVWMRGNRNVVKSSEELTITNGEDFSVLTFKSVLLTDSDRWSCHARNTHASDNVTIEIVVNMPPRWIAEPRSVQVVVGRSVTINCQAEGSPRPKIVWKKSNSLEPTTVVSDDENNHRKSAQFRDILSSYRYQVFSNGSLYLQEAEVADAGLYMCQISNGIGIDLSKVIQVQVQQPPRVESKFTSETVVRGQVATLQCRAQGDPVLRVEWHRDMQPIQPGAGQNMQRYQIKEDTSDNGARTTSFLEIQQVTRLDSALFTCLVTNNFGTDSSNIQLIVQGKFLSSVLASLGVRFRS